MLPVFIVDLFDHAELVGLVQAALSGDIALVPVGDAVLGLGAHAFELRVPGLRPVVLLGEPNGENSGGMLPVKLRPFDDAHAGQLLVLACSGPGDTNPGISDKYAPGSWERLSVVDRLELETPQIPDLTPPPFRAMSSIPRVDGLGQALSGDAPPRSDVIDPLVGRVLGGKFAIEAPLGAGATGVVYRAQQTALRRAVAVKVMHAHFRADPSFSKRFHAEALAASKLDHPNVLRVLDFGEEEDGLLYIAMELLSGKEFRTLLNERSMGREREMNVVLQVCSALMGAHDRGIVHRDIKPENVIIVPGLDEDGRPIDVVKVCDFGLATIEAPRAGRDDGSLAASAVNLVAGTPQYMSPEQIRGERLDARADLYAVGVMLFEVATRRLPFHGESVMDVVQMQLYNEPPRPRGIDPRIDPRLEAIILKALAKNRDDRYASARDLRAELRALTERRTVTRVTARSSVSLESPESGFLELFISLTTGLAPAGVRDAAERKRSHDRLEAATRTALAGRGELGFTTRLVDGRDLRVQSGTGEHHDVKHLVGAGAEPYVRRLVDALVERDVACLALREGVTPSEIAALVDAFEERLSHAELAQRLRRHAGQGVVVVFASDFLGRSRNLPRSVDLVLTRLALELAGQAGAALATGDTSGFAACVTDIVPGLHGTELMLLLTNVDLIYGANQGIAHLTRVDVRRALIEALATERLIDVGTSLLDERELRGPGTGHEASLPRVVAETLVGRDESDSYDLLRRFYEAGVIGVAELPQALRDWADAELLAYELERDAVATLVRLQAIPELDAYAREIERVRLAMRVLGRRAQTPALWATAARLKELAADAPPGEHSHEALAARAAETIREPEVLGAIAEALLGGTSDQRDAGIGILRGAGSAGARALLIARERLSSEQAVRARFVAAMRAVGDVGIAVIAEQLAQLAAEGPRCSPLLAEDLLRALPERPIEKLGPLVGEFVRHEAPTVRRSAVHVLAATLGPRARDWLVTALTDTDDSVRIAALVGLRQAGLVDTLAVSRIDRIVNDMQNGEELRAAAAGTLSAVLPEARPAAVDVLRRAIRPVRMSFMNMLKDVGSGGSESVLVLTTIARVLMSLAGPLGRNDVEARARVSRGEVKKALHALLGIPG